MDDDVQRRLDDLAERIARLEGGGQARPAAPALDPEVFWALNGLRERVTDPAGAVLFTGAVRLPTGEHYEWQQGASTGGLLGLDWASAAEVFGALGHPVRLRLLRAVLGGTGTTAALQELDDVGTTGQLYHHLKPLVAAGWLQNAGRGRYRVPGDRVVPLLAVLAAALPPSAD
ncbi:ArsR/SmtB family transcription factor [Actinokineospora bangkokensis]|uniref:ArsR family transcriptional regulator n=1 Tax=Actinokineospora bangkokensis TaxID=1193682 RepID=A0A1Q9LMM0_9PSEU|nr:helix-turn-helix domain-containing protein [Actinokineospora bangkokensis]OLR93234.1 ArsR family transcriptional regulator [Actinokineospora bangkokensis]